jgi:putative ABC transport system substrate-binding protein
MQRLATFATRYAMPTIGPLRDFATEGGLLSYGASIQEVNRQAGLLAGKILNGAGTADLPVQQPTKALRNNNCYDLGRCRGVIV